MNNDEYRSAGGLPRPVLSRGMRAGIVFAELILVGLIAVLLADFTFKVSTPEPRGLPLTRSGQREAAINDTSRLLAFDPFFRSALVAENKARTALPESTLNIQVFGLRAGSGGSGSAIIKLQDGEQKLVQVGDRLATGVQLIAVFPDRLELLRAGNKEAVYLRPEEERPAVKQQAGPQIVQRAPRQAGADNAGQIGLVFSTLSLTPVRRDRRIIGFRLPEPVPAPLLAAGLQGGDILIRANGSPLSSFERLQEIGDALPVSMSLLLEIERRGQMLELTVNLEENR